jgi:site-specific recombinase XerD
VGDGVLLLHGKGKKQRTVAPGVTALRALMTLPRDGEWVFPFGYSHIAYRLRQLSRRSGVKFHPHQFRHTFSHRLLEAGATIEELAEILGHVSIETTMIYLRAFRRERALESQRRLNPADRLFGQGPEVPVTARLR